MREVIGAQGEIVIYKISTLPKNIKTKPAEKVEGGFIISHSESGHHHLLTGGDVLEREDAPVGMQILYASLKEPQSLVQDAAVPHGSHTLPAGFYEFRIAREFDPFAQQARRVAD